MAARRVAAAAGLLFVAPASPALADSVYTKLDTGACEVLTTYEDGGRALRCPGLEGIDVFVTDGDARTDVDFGVPSGAFESFSTFNGVGDTIEWMRDDGGNTYAAAIRFLIDVDGRSAEALVVSRIGDEVEPGCVVGVVDAAADQANGIARGLGAMAPLFDCTYDQVVIVPGARELAGNFGGANRD